MFAGKSWFGAGWFSAPLRVLLVVVVALTGFVVLASPAAAAPCDPATGNAIACENAKTGTPQSTWDDNGKGDSSIEGFTTDISVNVGTRVDFKIKTTASAYTMDIYRMGYYQGNGARKITSVTPSAVLPQSQPECLSDAATGLIDCGNWAVSASWAVPSDAVSGVYFAKLSRPDTKEGNQIVFIVRNDASTSKMVFQTSDTSWQAYNTWGGNSFYQGSPAGRAYKLSYNRPFDTRRTSPDAQNWVYSTEYPMIKFMEGNGYDVSYISGLDTSRSGKNLLNHSTFITTGHDEYWSGAQWDNVKAARDAGVNLAFFAGNDVYWRTRWEPSIDSSATANRTLVSYKETWSNAKIDPAKEWTGTFRDPRFATAANGGGTPENSLTGTIFTVNCCSNAIQVPAADGKLRLWRNSAVAGLASGAVKTMPEGTLGYEWNSDLDNGFRNAGQIKLSSSTYTVPQKLQDYGSVVTQDTATHSLTEYKAASGALVFSAGTVQWSWGLDADHDGPATDTDDSMRQATVNLFADMGNQPTTLMSGLSAATKSTDTTAPSITLSSPVADASLSHGTSTTISGTASDTGGGRVGGVEVSTDGGTTWHPATGRESWTYTWSVTGAGTTKIMARASDDSLNLSDPLSRSVAVSCPCAMFSNETPKTVSDPDRSEIEAGVKFTPQIDGFVTGVKFYKATDNTGTHTGTLWTSNGGQLATGTFTGESDSGWQTLTFNDAVKVVAGSTYVVSYHVPAGHYSSTPEYFSARAIVQAPLTAPMSKVAAADNGVYAVGARAFPSTNSTTSANYFVSPVFDTVAPPDTVAPRIVASSPATGTSSVAPGVTPSVTASEPIAAGSLTLKLSSSAGTVAGGTALDSSRTVATFTPSAALARGVQYTLSTSGGADDAGNLVATSYSTSFRTSAAPNAPGVCPCTVFSEEDVPATITAADTNAVTLGVRFTSTDAGFVSGLKFYKGSQNVGTHVGKLWDAAGNELASATFTGESSSGWQEVRFANRVAVTAGTTYTVGYHTTVGLYSATSNGLAKSVTRAPLTAVGHNVDGKPDGVYTYGANPTFPTSGAGTNYWVDPIYEPDVDTTAPSVVSSSPASGATNVRTGVVPTVTMTEKVVSGATASLTGPSGSLGASVTADSATGRTLTVTPSATLVAATKYTISVNGATDAAGNKMSTPYEFSFTTSGATVCPCTLYPSNHTPGIISADDTNAVTLGVRFRADRDGTVTGVRFYKGPNNTGTHTGSLWTASGSVMATATFTNESATGWQSVQFATAVEVKAGTDYVVTYYAPAGKYSADAKQFTSTWSNSPLTAPADADGAKNGLYAYGGSERFPTSGYNGNGYGVDVVFVPGSANDTTPPKLVSTTPAGGATSVPRSTAFTAVFDEMLAADSLSATVVPAGGGSAVAVRVVGSTDGRTVTVTPTADLAYATTYTVTVTGKDLAGNAPPTAPSWTVRTAEASSTACPCLLFSDETLPATPVVADAKAVELGTRVTVTRDGQLTGASFYKGSGNTGTHTVNLWTTDGTLVRTSTSSGESATGWQQVAFATPVAVTAGSTYIVSYHTTSGNYSATANGFAAAVTRGPLTAPAGTDAAPNGVYRYGSTGFPSNASSASYLVGPIFAGDPGTPATPDPTPTATPTATPSATPTATPTPSATPAATPSATPTATPSATPTATPSATPTATPSATPTATATPADTTPPTVTGITPADGATAVPVSSTVTAVFSEDVTPASVVATLTTSGGTAVSAASAYTASSRQVTLTSAQPLASLTVYTVSVTASDVAGNAMTAPRTWTFTSADTVPPTVTAISPADGATAVSVTAAATATFSKDVNSASIVATLTSSGGSAVQAVTGYTASSRQVTVTPSQALASTSTYKVSVTASDAAGNAMVAPRTWTFTTADVVPPTVASVTPADGATAVPVASKPTAVFSEALAPGSVVATLALSGGTAVPMTATYDSATISVVITPSAALGSSTAYTATVKASDVAGNPLAQTKTWSFTTADVLPPTVTSFTPASGAVNVVAATRPTATFSEAVTPASIVATLTPASGSALAVTATYDSATRTATIAPAAALGSAVTYTVTVKASDLAGNAMPAATSWSFTSADVVAPVVTGVVATGSSTGVTVTWTTDESSSSVVQYGTSLTSLTSSATGADKVTAHSVTLTGLTGGTRYYYRVTSVDPSSNSATSPAASGNPASVTMPVDLALGAPVLASSTLESSPWGAAKAVDGVLTSTSSSYAWTSTSSLTANHTEFFQVDLGSAKSVNQVTLWPRTDSGNLGYGYPVNFTVATSTDGTTFSTASTVTGAALPTGAQNVTFTAQTGRYVRITGTSLRTNPNDGNQYRMQFAEVGVYNLGPATPGTAADLTAPVVSAVAAAGTGATGATVTWTTDEPSSSVVQYGVSATALTSTATGPDGVTSHSVPLTGLAPNTRYYYRVTSADPSANSTTSPATSAAAAQYAPTVTPIVHNNAATFTGTLSNTYLSTRAGGEVILAPDAVEEFPGTTVPSTWTSTSLATGSSVTVADNRATVSGRFFRSNSRLAYNREVDAVVTLRAVNNQWFGFAQTDFSSASQAWAAFRTTATGGLVAESRSSSTAVTTTNLSSSLLGSPHRYEVDWTSSGTTFAVDGVVVATHTRALVVLMYVAARDDTVDASPLTLDSVWTTPYESSGTYTSGVIDAGAVVDWTNLGWTATTATGTSVAMKVRTGPNATAGGTGWSAWTTVAQGADMPGVTRYVQYQATLTTGTTRTLTPVLSAVSLGYAIP